MTGANGRYHNDHATSHDIEKDMGLNPDESSHSSSSEEHYEPPTLSNDHSKTLATTSDLEKVQSRRSAKSRISLKTSAPTTSVNDATAIPDGGLQAWLQVLGSFLLFVNHWGIINTFGVYQTYYMNTLLPDYSPAAISWIGSVQSFLLGFVGPLMGPIYDAGYFRPLIMVGSFGVVSGHMMLSLCTQFWQVFLAQALCVGLGAGCLFVPSVAILSTYFSKRLALATGISAAGSSCGGTIYPIAVYHLIPMVGFAWATRIIGFIALATLVVANLVMKVRVLPSEKRKVLDLPSLKEAPYMLFIAGAFMAFMGLYAGMVYIESFALAKNILDPNLAFYSLAVINGASSFGRIIPNYIADKTGPLNIIIPATFVSGIIALCLIVVKDVAPLFIVCVLYGFFSGALVSLPPTVFVSLSLHKRHMIGTRMGMGFFFISIGLLLGTPVSGWILDASDYTYVWTFGGTMLIVASLLMFAGRTAKLRGLKPLAKA
ncbi:MFS general substrate transporter [Elsinoe ampelina]|uniref:MFS general substrate transporter n=1 Tax=Elsinoe ampelina TaxID=302913 RepID=A0A6A6GL40_9PEZI|nr:MFS general substrate transporter [Elsinoe ampelina]